MEPVYPKIIGEVIRGQGQGGKLGFHTANLKPELAKNLTTGLYQVTINIDGELYQGLLHYGYNSLQDRITLEVLIKNFSQNIYGEQIAVSIDRKCRETKRFKTQKEAAQTISEDYKMIR
jgi:riboflavin kinase/FMN adenylyltransferase